MTLGDGLERGIRMLEFRTGSGLRFTVLIDRAFDIADCDFKGQAIGWHSPSGFRHPALHEYEGERGLAWTRSFSGLVLTCGLDHILGPEETAADTCGRKARCARPPSVGALLAGSVGIARTTMQESPDFERQLASGTVPKRPLLDALTKFRLGILRAFAISGLGSITYYVGITYVPAFLVSVGKLNESESLRLSTAAAIAVIVVTPFAGILSDRLGRKPVLISLCALSAILPVSLFYWMATGSPSYALIGALILAGVAGGDQRGRRDHDRRTIPRRRPHQRPGVERDDGDRHLRRPHPLCRLGADGANRLDNCPRRHDRRGRRPGPAGPGDFAGDGAQEISLRRPSSQPQEPRVFPFGRRGNG